MDENSKGDGAAGVANRIDIVETTLQVAAVLSAALTKVADCGGFYVSDESAGASSSSDAADNSSSATGASSSTAGASSSTTDASSSTVAADGAAAAWRRDPGRGPKSHLGNRRSTRRRRLATPVESDDSDSVSAPVAAATRRTIERLREFLRGTLEEVLGAAAQSPVAADSAAAQPHDSATAQPPVAVDGAAAQPPVVVDGATDGAAAQSPDASGGGDSQQAVRFETVSQSIQEIARAAVRDLNAHILAFDVPPRCARAAARSRSPIHRPPNPAQPPPVQPPPVQPPPVQPAAAVAQQEGANGLSHMDDDEADRIVRNKVSQPFVEYPTPLEIYESELLFRVLSFANYTGDNEYELALAGWSGTDRENVVFCANCYAYAVDSDSSDDVLTVHALISPHCQFVKNVVVTDQKKNDIDVLEMLSRCKRESLNY